MQTKYVKQSAPFMVPTTDGKVIAEHFGNASTQDGAVSVAHMTAPAGWSEPAQCPDFDEYTLMVSGQKMVEIDGEKVVLKAGESLLVRRGARVRYSNPFEADAEYWSVCIPAFSPESVHREDG